MYNTPSDFDYRIIRGERPTPSEEAEEKERRREAALRAPQRMRGYYRLLFEIIDEPCPF